MSRRFSILVTSLVALNLFLWLVPAGVAMRSSLVGELFGPSMIRAEVVDRTASGRTKDYRIDRGVVTAVAGGRVTLMEDDGTVRSIRVVQATQLSGVQRSRLASLARRSVQVLVVSSASGKAVSLDVEA
jgi:hypothetical protein